MELPGIWNLRDLAGLGGLSKGAFLRSENPHGLNAASWDELAQRGVTTVIDLRTTAEAENAPAGGPLTRIHVPMEDGLQQSPVMKPWFEDGRIGTPLYYAPFTETWPERVSEVLNAIAAADGGVLVHCIKGCDRTGMIAALVLEALDTPREAIVADYLRTIANVAGPVARKMGVRDDRAFTDAVLAREGTTFEEALNDYLDGVSNFLEPHRSSLRHKFHESR